MKQTIYQTATKRERKQIKKERKEKNIIKENYSPFLMYEKIIRWV